MAKRSDERLEWTEAGRAGLAEEKSFRGQTFVQGDEAKKRAAAVVKKYAPRWKKGVTKSDAVGKAAIAYATKWKPGAKGTPEQLAGLVSLAAANSESPEAAVIEQVIVDHGWDVTMRALVASWSLLAYYGKGNSWVTAIAGDHQSVFDTSACSGKGDMTRYLQCRYWQSDAAEREAMKKAVDAAWPKAPRHAKPALAVATNDAARAKEIVKDLLANDEPHAFFAWETLPHILADAELVEQSLEKRSQGLSYRIVENLGPAAIPLFEARISARVSKDWRARFLGMMANIRSSRVAKILAEYAEEEPYTEVVRAYFKLHPDLLELMLADPELKYYHQELHVLKAAS